LPKIPNATLYNWVSHGTAPPFYKIDRVSLWKRSAVMAGSMPTSTTPRASDRIPLPSTWPC